MLDDYIIEIDPVATNNAMYGQYRQVMVAERLALADLCKAMGWSEEQGSAIDRWLEMRHEVREARKEYIRSRF